MLSRSLQEKLNELIIRPQVLTSDSGEKTLCNLLVPHSVVCKIPLGASNCAAWRGKSGGLRVCCTKAIAVGRCSLQSIRDGRSDQSQPILARLLTTCPTATGEIRGVLSAEELDIIYLKKLFCIRLNGLDEFAQSPPSLRSLIRSILNSIH